MGKDHKIKKAMIFLAVFLFILLGLSLASYLIYNNEELLLNLVSSQAGTLSLIILFIVVFLSSFGVPGALFLMIGFGAVAAKFSDLLPLILVATSAAILGDVCAYLLARKFSSSLPSRLERFSFFRNGGVKIKEMLINSEFYLVFLTRFLFTALCAPMNYIAGFEKLDFKKFVAGVVLGEAIYGSMFFLIGFLFSGTWIELSKTINNVAIGVGLLIAVLVIIILYSINKRRKNK